MGLKQKAKAVSSTFEADFQSEKLAANKRKEAREANCVRQGCATFRAADLYFYR
jgi:hypothetical protein